MKLPESDVIKIAEKVLRDLHQEFYVENCIEKVFVDPGSTNTAIWLAAFKISAFDTTEFLSISDETSEPIDLQTSTEEPLKLIKGDDGKYRYKN